MGRGRVASGAWWARARGRSAVRFWRACRWTLRGFPPGRTAPLAGRVGARPREEAMPLMIRW